MNPNIKELTQSIIALLVVGGAVASIFITPVGEAGTQIIRVLAGTVVGFYFGAGTTPAFGTRPPAGAR